VLRGLAPGLGGVAVGLVLEPRRALGAQRRDEVRVEGRRLALVAVAVAVRPRGLLRRRRRRRGRGGRGRGRAPRADLVLLEARGGAAGRGGERLEVCRRAAARGGAAAHGLELQAQRLDIFVEGGRYDHDNIIGWQPYKSGG